MAIRWWRGHRFNDRTIDMIQAAEEIRGITFSIAQGSYNSSVGASAGTHDGGGAVDIWQHDWNTVKALRQVGFAAWYRSSAQGPWSPHTHAIAIGDNDLSGSAANQVRDYRNGRNGLANNGPDNGPNVPFTTFEDYLEEELPLSNDDIQKIAEKVWSIDTISPPDYYDHKTNKNWQPQRYLKEIRERLTNDALVYAAWQFNSDNRHRGPAAPPSYVAGAPENTNWNPERYIAEIWEYLHGMSPETTKAVELLESLVDRDLGSDAQEIKDHIDARAAEAEANRAEVLQKVSELQVTGNALVELLDNFDAAELSAEDVVDALKDMVHKATEPDTQEESN